MTRKLGAGAFGTVYLGEHHVHGTVAVKLFRRTPLESDCKWHRRRQDLLREGQNLAKATHERIVQVFDVVRHDEEDAVALVMEYLPGGSLETPYLSGPSCLHSVRDWMTGVAIGLQALHIRNMVHRDIKPANILLDEDGKSRIGDFGLVTDDLVLGYASGAGYFDHLPPETFAGHGTSQQSDVWAFGMTTYRLIHGSEWYLRSPRPKDIVSKGQFSKKLRWLPHVPREWRNFIRKCLHDDKEHRYHDFQQVLGGMARLPVSPNWETEIDGDLIRWNRLKGGRRHEVEWQEKSPRCHRWSATSLPAQGTGRRRKIGGSDGDINSTAVRKQLEKFFEEAT